VGHGLAALAVGWTAAGREGRRVDPFVQGVLLVALGVAPDLDLLIGRHSAETHSLGAAMIVASIAAWRRWPLAATPMRIWIVACLAWFSHPILDSLGRDGTPPLGVMMFWPLSTAYFTAPWQVFEAITRRYRELEFWPHNSAAVMKEIFILAPLALVARVLAKRGGPAPASPHPAPRE
jgi:membrane-bound metal-dependent hydrolase YbcI (DUF457 family)